MAEVKKNAAKAVKAAAVKTAAKKTPAKAVANKTASGSVPTAKMPIASQGNRAEPTHSQIAGLAHKYWVERGGYHGGDERDWLRAEKELKG